MFVSCERSTGSMAPGLQCAIPAFQGLFPDEHDNVIRILLFRMAEWHALAKMRLHSEDTLFSLSQSLRRLGAQLRKFSRFTCSAFQTTELPGETAARYRRQPESGMGAAGPKPKSFNLFTYKLHALGDYVQSIRAFGTTDSYTTQIVCALFQRVVFMAYFRCRENWPIAVSRSSTG
jgi:hypothetical protein